VTRRDPRLEVGSITPLIAGSLALAIALILGVSSATSLTLERHRLVALAEATALHAADSFDPALLTRSGGLVRAPLSDRGVLREAGEYLNRVGATRHLALRLLIADTPDGLRARVVLSSRWEPPVVSEFLPWSVTLRAEALSRSLIG